MSKEEITYPPILQSIIEKKTASIQPKKVDAQLLTEKPMKEEQTQEIINTEETKIAAVTDNVDSLIRVATHFRAMQLLAHNAHNLISGPTFFEDHEFFGELYSEFESSYDRLIELIIGNGDKPNLVSLQSEAVGKLSSLTQENHFQAVLTAEEQLQGEIEEFVKTGPSQAALNMFGDLAEKSKVRIYKLRQRLAS